MSGRFACSNLYQNWYYGAAHSRGILRRISRAALIADGRCEVLAQFRIKKLPLGPGVAEAEWAPLFDTPTVIKDPSLLFEFLKRVKAEYCERRNLDLRITPRSTLSSAADGVICSVLKECGFQHNTAIRSYKTVILDLSRDLATIRKALDQKWRNQLNVAEKASLGIETGNSSEMFERFYAVYQEMWAHKRFPTGVRVPTIRKLQKTLPDAQRLHVTIAKEGNRDVGATACAYCGDSLLYFLGATSPQLRQNCRPGYLLQWAHITAAKDRGLRWYDTGGIPDDAPEITRFKTRMNGTVVQFPGRFDLASRAESSKVYSLAEKGYHALRRLTTGR